MMANWTDDFTSLHTGIPESLIGVSFGGGGNRRDHFSLYAVLMERAISFHIVSTAHKQDFEERA